MCGDIPQQGVFPMSTDKKQEFMARGMSLFEVVIL